MKHKIFSFLLISSIELLSASQSIKITKPHIIAAINAIVSNHEPGHIISLKTPYQQVLSFKSSQIPSNEWCLTVNHHYQNFHSNDERALNRLKRLRSKERFVSIFDISNEDQPTEPLPTPNEIAETLNTIPCTVSGLARRVAIADIIHGLTSGAIFSNPNEKLRVIIVENYKNRDIE